MRVPVLDSLPTSPAGSVVGQGAGEAALKAAGLSKSIVTVAKRKGKLGSGAIKRTGWARSAAGQKVTAEHVDAARKQDAAALAVDGSQSGQRPASTMATKESTSGADGAASAGGADLQEGSGSSRRGTGSAVATTSSGGAASGSGTAAARGDSNTSGTSSGAATTTTASDDTTEGSDTTSQAVQQQDRAGSTGTAAAGQQGAADSQQRRQLLQIETEAAAQDDAALTSTSGGGDAKGSSTADGTEVAGVGAAAEGSSSEGVALGSHATLAELNHAGSQADDLARALEALGLTSSMGSTVMAVAGAPIARWALHNGSRGVQWRGRAPSADDCATP